MYLCVVKGKFSIIPDRFVIYLDFMLMRNASGDVNQSGKLTNPVCVCGVKRG